MGKRVITTETWERLGSGSGEMRMTGRIVETVEEEDDPPVPQMGKAAMESEDVNQESPMASPQPKPTRLIVDLTMDVDGRWHGPCGFMDFGRFPSVDCSTKEMLHHLMAVLHEFVDVFLVE